MEYTLKTPLSMADILKPRAGDVVYLDGIILTARDRAHERLLSSDKIPFDLSGAAIFHCGPLMRKNKKWTSIAVGPTTSARMSKMTPELLKKYDIRAIIGKGGMKGVVDALYEKCIYLAYPGGCAAIATDQIKVVKEVHWLDLGMPEAIWVLGVEQFGPLIVGIDAHGNDLYAEVAKKASERMKSLK